MSYDLKLENGDFVIDTQGDVIVLENYDKLEQDLLRLVYTSPGDNPFDEAEGIGAYDLLGAVIPRDINETLLGKQVYFGIQHMIGQQADQALMQYVSPEERIATIDGIILHKAELKVLNFEILLTTVKGQQEAFAFNIE